MVKLERCWPWLERRGLQSGDHSPWHSSLYKRRPSEDFWNEYSDSGVALPRRGKRFRLRHGPGLAEARIAGAVDQFARAQRRIEPRE